jgi:hypothetical protein
MGQRLIIIFLIIVMLSLLIPVTSHYYASETAFTAGNLIRINSSIN